MMNLVNIINLIKTNMFDLRGEIFVLISLPMPIATLKNILILIKFNSLI